MYVCNWFYYMSQRINKITLHACWMQEIVKAGVHQTTTLTASCRTNCSRERTHVLKIRRKGQQGQQAHKLWVYHGTIIIMMREGEYYFLLERKWRARALGACRLQSAITLLRTSIYLASPCFPFLARPTRGRALTRCHSPRIWARAHMRTKPSSLVLSALPSYELS